MSKEYSMAANAHSIANYLGIEFGAAWQVAKCRYKVHYKTEEEAQAKADEWGAARVSLPHLQRLALRERRAG